MRYKYNLTKGSQRYERNDKGVIRYYFPMQDIILLLEKIVYDRHKLSIKYGQAQYEKYMEMNRVKGQKSKGFWRQAKYV